jgi:hypothetical protein
LILELKGLMASFKLCSDWVASHILTLPATSAEAQ